MQPATKLAAPAMAARIGLCCTKYSQHDAARPPPATVSAPRRLSRTGRRRIGRAIGASSRRGSGCFGFGASWPSAAFAVADAAAAVAKAEGIDYVIINDSLPPVEPAGLVATKQQLAMRRVLFAAEDMDLTDAVIARANADFKAAGGTVPVPAKP